jgi:hypothetical protein
VSLGDADGLSLSRKGRFFREVRGKSPAARRRRALTGGRAPLAGISIALSNQRGVILRRHFAAS